MGLAALGAPVCLAVRLSVCLRHDRALILLRPRCFAVGSKDMSTWVFGAERWDNLIYYALGGHKDAIVACFFESNSLDVRPDDTGAGCAQGAPGFRCDPAPPPGSCTR